MRDLRDRVPKEAQQALWEASRLGHAEFHDCLEEVWPDESASQRKQQAIDQLEAKWQREVQARQEAEFENEQLRSQNTKFRLEIMVRDELPPRET